MIQPPQFFLEKPDLSRIDIKKIVQIWEHNLDRYRQIITSANEPKYLYWDDFKHKAQREELNSEEQWFLVKQFRQAASIKTPIKAISGEYFNWFRPPTLDEQLHKIDMLVGGQLFRKSAMPIENTDIYINRGVIEEAIASSQLEGAHTTRAVAKQMLLEKRKPRNESEQMILNNYKAMISLEENFKNRPLSKESLFELHSILTEGTIDPKEQKRLRNDADKIVVQGDIGNTTFISHVPPKASFLNNEIDQLIAYANDVGSSFIHPVIKAIFIHFWVGYLHPFTDGNGRLARALFYWYLLRHEYWTFTYIPISTSIKKSPSQYAMAYIYTEQDSCDLTYFFNYHMRKIDQAINEFENYVTNQIKQNALVDQMIGKTIALNERQKALIYYFISDEHASTTALTHATINNITRQTAAKDLKELEQHQWIKSVREGKFIKFYPTNLLHTLTQS